MMNLSDVQTTGSDLQAGKSPSASIWVRFWRLIVTLCVCLSVIATAALFIENQTLSSRLSNADKHATDLERQLDNERANRKTAFAQVEHSIAESKKQYPSIHDLSRLQTEVDKLFETTQRDIDRLERSFHGVEHTVATASKSTILLQSAFQLVDSTKNKPLRYVVVGENETPLFLPDGTPIISIDGQGPVFEPVATGSGFVTNGGKVITNRHVVNSWESGPIAQFLSIPEIKPVRTRLRGFSPTLKVAFELDIDTVSEDHDLAVLSARNQNLGPLTLELSDQPPSPGTQVVVLGYPLGLRAMLARAGREYVALTQSRDIEDHWDLADQLAIDGEIHPLASTGIVAQVTRSAVVYDAETASGGSGGPILTLDNKVVAVNAAMLPGFGGSNLGIPSAVLLQLLGEYLEPD